jgi:hypothetical protein
LSVASCAIDAWRVVVAHAQRCPIHVCFNAAVIVQIAMTYDARASEADAKRVRRYFHQKYTPRAFKDAESAICALLDVFPGSMPFTMARSSP